MDNVEVNYIDFVSKVESYFVNSRCVAMAIKVGSNHDTDYSKYC